MGHKAVAGTEPSAPAAVREKDDSGRRRWNTEEAIEGDIPICNCDRPFPSLVLWWCHTRLRLPGLFAVHLPLWLRHSPLQEKSARPNGRRLGLVLRESLADTVLF